METLNSTPKVLETKGEIPFVKAIRDATKLDFNNLTSKTSLKAYKVFTIDDLMPKVESSIYALNDANIFWYNGTYWNKIDKREISDLLTEYSLKVGVPFVDADDCLFKENLLKQFISKCKPYKKEVSQGVAILNLKNGTLKVENGVRKMFPFDQNDYCHYQLDFDYNQDAKAPLFHKFLNEAIPNKELQNLLAEYVGTCFIPNEASTHQSERILSLKGEGSNGKGVLSDILSALFGKENVARYSLNSLTKSANTRINIENKLLNISSESGREIKEENFKLLASGEPIQVEAKYEQPRIMTNYAKIIVSLNSDLWGGDGTHSYYRRFMIIPMENKVKEENKDKMLADKIIKSELSGVLNWILDGLDRYILQEGNFTFSELSSMALEQYKINDNRPLQFLIESGYKVGNNRTLLPKLYLEFREWSEANGNKNIETKQGFSSRIKKAELYGKEIKHYERDNSQYKAASFNVYIESGF